MEVFAKGEAKSDFAGMVASRILFGVFVDGKGRFTPLGGRGLLLLAACLFVLVILLLQMCRHGWRTLRFVVLANKEGSSNGVDHFEEKFPCRRRSCSRWCGFDWACGLRRPVFQRGV